MNRRELFAGACALPLFGQTSATKRIELITGHLTLVFGREIAFARCVRAADRETLPGIYGAVRNSVWGTVPAQIRNVQVERNDGGFLLTARHGTCYSINPQVHAFDYATLVENLEAQASTVRTARSFAADRWIAVTYTDA